MTDQPLVITTDTLAAVIPTLDAQERTRYCIALLDLLVKAIEDAEPIPIAHSVQQYRAVEGTLKKSARYVDPRLFAEKENTHE